MKTVRVRPSNTISFEAMFVVALTAALVVSVWWILSDREPTQKEMTFAYRKHLVAISRDGNSKGEAEIRPHLHAIELTKQRCQRHSHGSRCFDQRTSRECRDPLHARHPCFG